MNVVFIVLDTLRRDRVGAYSDAVEFTPHLDRFADDAVVYEDAVAQAPWTLPSHASMFTGLYPWEHDATQKNLYLETDQELLAERFDDAGYRTACYTANTWLSPYTGMTDGFDEVDNFFPVLPSDLLPGVGRGLLRRVGERTLGVLTAIGDRFHAFFEKRGDESKTATILEKAERFIDGCGDDEEFFLFLNLLDPHEPYYPPEEYRERHAPGVDPHDLCHDPAAYYAGEEDVDIAAMQELYDASVDYLDDQVGG
ncbi:MAG: sulfatase-like hydrolase/transferase, partial [Candidatus Nanohaloarchaea archaeon]|nr:sulfatase-like hydrolase/transferase [Candidatus Nanohaloarchaea archaeon]